MQVQAKRCLRRATDFERHPACPLKHLPAEAPVHRSEAQVESAGVAPAISMLEDSDGSGAVIAG